MKKKKERKKDNRWELEARDISRLKINLLTASAAVQPQFRYKTEIESRFFPFKIELDYISTNFQKIFLTSKIVSLDSKDEF